MSSITVSEDGYGDDQSKAGVRRFTMTNSRGMVVAAMNYGATITSIKVPDRQGHVDDVALGFDSPEEYYLSNCYIGSTIGRVANRIANGKFSLNGKEYTLCRNNGPNHLHGGLKGYDKVLWQAEALEDGVVFSHQDEAREGYPGTVVCRVTFRLTEDNELVIQYKATASEPTPISLTNHSYFNLSGHENLELIHDHLITINADAYTPIDGNGIPSGDIFPVKGTNFEFRQPGRMGSKFDLLPEGGYDHNFCIKGTGKRAAAKLVHPNSGRVMEVFSTMPGLQLYTSNFFPKDDSLKGRGQRVYHRHSGVCLETQHYPNAINETKFPSCILNPGDAYDEVTIYKFSVTS